MRLVEWNSVKRQQLNVALAHAVRHRAGREPCVV
jgi:hypothetical protein